MFNQYKLTAFPFVLVVAASVTGCGADMDDALERCGEAEVDSLVYSPEYPSTQSIVIANSLDPMALTPSDLGVHPLSISGMSTTTVALVTGPSGTLVRQLLKYAVGCALDTQSRFEFSWFDATGAIHDESYAGSSGIAPAWSVRALDVAEQEWVSACLAARANWYRKEVKISMRASLPVLHGNTIGEVTSFPNSEGAFWGNLFSDTPFLHACYDSTNVTYSRLHYRDCAVGHVENGSEVECGIIDIIGPCQQTCLAPTNGGYYPSCPGASGGVPGSGQAQRVITVFLP